MIATAHNETETNIAWKGSKSVTNHTTKTIARWIKTDKPMLFNRTSSPQVPPDHLWLRELNSRDWEATRPLTECATMAHLEPLDERDVNLNSINFTVAGVTQLDARNQTIAKALSPPPQLRALNISEQTLILTNGRQIQQTLDRNTWY